MNVPFVDLGTHNRQLEESLLNRVRAVLRDGGYILGKVVEEFEERFAAYCGSRFAVAVNSGTDALFLALKALDLGPGDEVVTVPNSFIATASSIVACGATPVFVDVAADLNMDPARVEEKISSRTKAILPVHLTGRPAAMNRLQAIADTHGLAIIEDAAQAVGATWQGKKVGAWGQLGCFSLHPLKILGALGDGGIITTDDEALCDALRKLRNFGLRDRETVEIWGFNSRLDTLQAAILLEKMVYLEKWIEQRRAIAAFYRQHLPAALVVPPEEGEGRAVYQTFVVRTDQRELLMRYLAEHGVETRVHYAVPLHLQPVGKARGYRQGDFPQTERLAAQILSLPIYPELAPDKTAYVVQCIWGFYGDHSLH